MILEIVSQSDVLVDDHAHRGVNVENHRHEVRVTQSVVTFFLDFALYSFYEPVFCKVIGLAWNNF